MKTKIRNPALLAAAALLGAISVTPAVAQESALERRLARLEAQLREQAASVQRHDSQLTNLNAKVGSTEEKLNKLLEITEEMAERQLRANDRQIAAAKSPQVTPVSASSSELEPQRSAFEPILPNRRQYRYRAPGVVIVISGFGYYSDDPFHRERGSDPFESDYYGTDYESVVCR